MYKFVRGFKRSSADKSDSRSPAPATSNNTQPSQSENDQQQQKQHRHQHQHQHQLQEQEQSRHQSKQQESEYRPKPRSQSVVRIIRSDQPDTFWLSSRDTNKDDVVGDDEPTTTLDATAASKSVHSFRSRSSDLDTPHVSSHQQKQQLQKQLQTQHVSYIYQSLFISVHIFVVCMR